MPIFFNDQSSMFFSHVPKTGGSHVERIAQLNGWRMLLHNAGLEPHALPGLTRSLQHITWPVCETLVQKSQFTKMAMIYRDPFERFCSEYFWLKTKFPELRVEVFVEDFLEKTFASRYNFDGHLSPQKHYYTAGMKVFVFEQDGVDKACNFFFGNSHRKHSSKELVKKLFQIRIDKATQKEPESSAYLLKFKKEISRIYADDYSFASEISNAS